MPNLKKRKTFYRYKEKLKIEKNELNNIKQELKLLDQDLGHIKKLTILNVHWLVIKLEVLNISISAYYDITTSKNCSLEEQL